MICDVEDYFQVFPFASYISRASWPSRTAASHPLSNRANPSCLWNGGRPPSCFEVISTLSEKLRTCLISWDVVVPEGQTPSPTGRGPHRVPMRSRLVAWLR